MPHISNPKKEELTAEEQAIVDDLKESFGLIQLHLQGKIKLQTAREMLAEWDEEERQLQNP